MRRRFLRVSHEGCGAEHERAFGRRRPASLDEEGEGAADAGGGGDADLAAVQLGELAGDEEAEAAAAVGGVGAGGGLGEAFEEEAFFVGGESAAWGGVSGLGVCFLGGRWLCREGWRCLRECVGEEKSMLRTCVLYSDPNVDSFAIAPVFASCGID